MVSQEPTPSERKIDLLERAYQYVLSHGLAELSLRPLASAIGSSPRVLLYLFGSKDDLVRALLDRARTDELALLDRLHELHDRHSVGMNVVAERIWNWLAAPEHRPLLALWVEGYGRSLISPGQPWDGFARSTVEDWLTMLAAAQRPDWRDTSQAEQQRTLVLAVLRGALLDLLATGDERRATAAVRAQLACVCTQPQAETLDTAMDSGRQPSR